MLNHLIQETDSQAGEGEGYFFNLKIIVVFHSWGDCSNVAIRDFLKEKIKKLVYIDHPFSFCRDTRSSISVFERGALVQKTYAPKIKGPEILFYIKDVLLTIYFILGLRERFNIYIGIDNLNSFVGLLLKKLGIVKKIIFYTIDYVPNRFKNQLLNRLYHLIDKICCYNVDCIWNMSPVMAEARSKNGISEKKSAPCLVVSKGHDFDQSRLPSFEEINRFEVVFLGRIQEGKGVEFIIDAFPNVCKEVPQAKLTIIGTGPLELRLKDKVRALGLSDRIRFTGFLDSNAEIAKVMMYSAVALATFEPHAENLSYYANPGKIRFYLGVGLPVVITDVPAAAQEIANARAGIVIKYDQKDFTRAVVKLLTDDKFYLECRKNAIELGSQYSWTKIMAKAFQETFAILSGEEKHDI